MSTRYKLQELDPKEIGFSKKNPRHETEAEIVAEDTFEQLKDSVAQFGVLVPVVVHEDAKNSKKPYVLIDGERRLRAALVTGTPKIPAHIVTGNDTLGELTQAFHIHMLRKQWKPIAQARSFKSIYAQIKKEGKEQSHRSILLELQARTGCTDKQIKGFQRVLKYPAGVLDEVESGRIAYSYLVTFEENFVEPVVSRFPDIEKTYPQGKMRKILVDKVRKNVETKTRTLINSFRPLLLRAREPQEKKCLSAQVKKFLAESSMSVEDIESGYNAKFPPQAGVLKASEKLLEYATDFTGLLETLDVTSVLAYPKRTREIKAALEELQRVLNRKLRQIRKAVSG